MEQLIGNPSEGIVEDGEYILAEVYAPGAAPVRVEVYGNRGGGSVQPGFVDPLGGFNPALASVTDADDPCCWEIDPPYTGKIAIKLNGSTNANLRVVASQTRK